MTTTTKAAEQQDFRAAGMYMLVSILLIYFNKATFSYYHFEAPNVLTLSQNVCSLVLLLACKHGGYIEFHDFSMRNLRKLLGLGCTFIAYMVFGMIAMKVVNIPMYTTLRRTTVVFVMLLEWVISRKSSNLSIKFAVGLMVLGAGIAGVRDLNFDLIAYLIVVVYNLCTAAYLVLINHISTGEKNKVNSVVPNAGMNASNSAGVLVQKLDKYDFMFYNNLISIPLLTLIILTTGETEAAVNSPYWSDNGFILSLLASSLLAFVLNYTIFWNTAVNSALTQTVSGQAKDIVVVFLGFILFDDAHVDPINILGVLIGFAGSLFYALTKIFPQTCAVEPIWTQVVAALNPKKNEDATLPFTVKDTVEVVNNSSGTPMAEVNGSSSDGNANSKLDSPLLYPHRPLSSTVTEHLTNVTASGPAAFMSQRQ